MTVHRSHELPTALRETQPTPQVAPSTNRSSARVLSRNAVATAAGLGDTKNSHSMSSVQTLIQGGGISK